MTRTCQMVDSPLKAITAVPTIGTIFQIENRNNRRHITLDLSSSLVDASIIMLVRNDATNRSKTFHCTFASPNANASRRKLARTAFVSEMHTLPLRVRLSFCNETVKQCTCRCACTNAFVRHSGGGSRLVGLVKDVGNRKARRYN